MGLGLGLGLGLGFGFGLGLGVDEHASGRRVLYVTLPIAQHVDCLGRRPLVRVRVRVRVRVGVSL